MSVDKLREFVRQTNYNQHSVLPATHVKLEEDASARRILASEPRGAESFI
jgi:hypothetical protein